MDIEVVAIGKAEIIEEIIAGYVYSKQDTVFLISIPNNLYKYTLNLLKAANIEVMDYSQYITKINASVTFSTISQGNSEKAYNWLRSGRDYFYTISENNRYEMHSIDKKKVKVESTAEPITKCFMSNNGCIYGFIRGYLVSFHIGDDLDLFWDIKINDVPNKILYSENNEFILIFTNTYTEVYNLLLGQHVTTISAIDLEFVGETVCSINSDKVIDCSIPIKESIYELEHLKIGDKDISCNAFDANKKAKFVDGQLQKIVFSSDVVTSKNYTNVKEVNFYFGQSRLFASLVKIPEKKEYYYLDSFHNNEVSTNVFDHSFVNVAVSDNFFVVQLADFKIQFYIKEKHSFRLVKSIQKDGLVVVAVKNYVSCVFDDSTSTIEFYDRAVLRASFSHPGCTHIKWSESGLYVATFSYSNTSGCLVQIFNCNGSLMYKKVYNSLKDFKWRTMPPITEDEKKRILQEYSLEEIEEQEDDELINKTLLTKKWKEYLMSKMVKVE